jgi:hypothetical protein
VRIQGGQMFWGSQGGNKSLRTKGGKKFPRTRGQKGISLRGGEEAWSEERICCLLPETATEGEISVWLTSLLR